jgi:adenylate kinase family enzyme
MSSLAKVAVIGNAGGGKSVLSRQLAKNLKLPLTHVDGVQYLEGLQVRPVDDTRKILNEIANSSAWLIDGFGPMDVIEHRFKAADKIIFIDFPLWRHYWWCTKRQVKLLWSPQSELPGDADDASITGTIKIYKILWRVHTKIRPKLVEMLELPEVRAKVISVRSLSEWSALFLASVL